VPVTESTFSETSGFSAPGATVAALPVVEACRKYSHDGAPIAAAGMKSSTRRGSCRFSTMPGTTAGGSMPDTSVVVLTSTLNALRVTTASCSAASWSVLGNSAGAAPNERVP